MRYRNCRTFSASERVWNLEQSSEIPIIHTEGENRWCFSVSIPLINDLKHQGFGVFFRSKFHLNNYVQEENKSKKVYKQTCLALELERIPQYAPKITRKKNTHMCVWTHMNFFRHQLAHAFEVLGGLRKCCKTKWDYSKEIHIFEILFSRMIYSLSESRCFPSPGSVGWGEWRGEEGEGKKEQRQWRLQ